MNKNNGELTIKDIVNIILPKLWFIVLISISCAVILGTFTAMKRDTFTSVSTFMMVKVPTSNSEATNTGLNAAEIEAMQSMIDSSKFILDSKTFCQSVKDMLVTHEDVTVSQIRSMLSISIMGDSTCFTITTRSNDPQLSKDVADIVHKLFPEDIKDRLPYAIAISTLDYPEIAASADGKNTTRNTCIGFIAGALLSTVLVFLMAKFDIVIRSREKLEEASSVPILGVIPRLESDN